MELLKIKKLPRTKSTNKNRYFFEIRGKKVIDLEANIKSANIQINELFSTLPRCYRSDFYCRSRISIALRNFTVKTSQYRVKLLLSRQSFNPEGIVFMPQSREIGESEQEFVSENSNFQKVLKELDPETDFLYFLVRSDSFDTFETIWNITEEKDFAVGWNPMKENNGSIVLGSNGRAITCQSGSC